MFSKHLFSFGVIYYQRIHFLIHVHFRLSQFINTFRFEVTLLIHFRLSQLAGVQMTENNPNVTDLSDINRPINLGEDFSEIYDNEYTDVLVYLKRKSVDVKNMQDKLLKTAEVSFS